MEKRNSLSVSSANSRDLCFFKEEFAKENFSVDSFVREHRQHATLETLREDLGIYLRILHASMVELINQDYADFVNLSTNLAGLDKSINGLCVPLGQLREEVLSVKVSLEEALMAVEFHIQRLKEARQKKVTLQRVREIVNGVEKLQRLVDESPINSSTFQLDNSRSVPGSAVERIATELNQLQFHLDRVQSGIPLVDGIRPRVESIWVLVEEHLEKAFLANLSKENLRNVLRICLIIDKCKKIQTLFLKQVVRPYMMEVISDSALQQYGVKKMLDRVIDFVRNSCKQLLEITDGEGDYEFVTEVIWPEVISCLESRTPMIFSPGNPNHFHQNYLASMEFLGHFESVCSPETVKKLKSSSDYNSFLEKWNLPVYFQIRFREIAGLLEKSLVTPFETTSAESEFKLHASDVLWFCLNRCWSVDVFLPPLVHRFWKLTLQLLARFRCWADKVVQSADESAADDGKMLVTNGPSAAILGSNEHPNDVIQTVHLVSDIELLCSKVPLFYNDIIREVLTADGFEEVDCLEGDIRDAVSALALLPSRLGELVIRDLSAQCTRHIKLATDIPRLYRKTNREVPHKPSSYVANILQPVTTFYASHADILPVTMWRDWNQKIVQCIAEQYLSVTRDVLTSVRKMEDSLKRLKKAREKTPTGNSTGGTGAGTVGDDDKIRLQFGLDVQNFGKTIEALGIKPEDVASYQLLLEFVESARSSPGVVS